MALFRYDQTNNKLVPITSEGSVGIPVGAVQGFALGTQSPNWLLCDGRDTTGTEDELQTHYPALYTYLGNSNVLPDYRECVLVGVGQNDTDTIAEHDVYTLGQFKDDQLQNITGKYKCSDYVFKSPNRTTTEGAFDKDDDSAINYQSNGGSSGGASILFDASRVARTGTTTHSKQKGVAFYIKATSAGIEVDRDLYATKGYVSGWLDITSDWSLVYVQTGTPTLEKVLWRPSTQELKVIVNATDISVNANATWSITASYDGTDQTIINMKNSPFEHAASIMPTNTSGTYRLNFVPDSISFDTDNPRFYATVKNATTSSGKLEHVVYHITL